MSQFIKKLSERIDTKIDCISPDVYRICSQYNWPGNIRELQNVVDRAVNLAEGNVLSSDLLPGSLAESTDDRPQNPNAQKLRNARRTTEQNIILRCLEKYRGNMTLAAKELGIARSTLYQKVRELNSN
jgi:transcriptional regulator with PAS, ATPase and Fis domain